MSPITELSKEIALKIGVDRYESRFQIFVWRVTGLGGGSEETG